MIDRIKRLSTAIGISLTVLTSIVTLASPVSVFASTAITKDTDPSACSQSFLTFPTWFRGLAKVQPTADGSGQYECAIETPDEAGGLSAFIWHIVLNVIEIGLQIVGYLAAGFILWGGFLFLTSQGEPEAAKKARTSILNAVIGLGISIASIAIINLLSGILIRK